MRAKINIFFVFVLLGYLVIFFRFFYWQIIRAKELSALAVNQHQRRSIQTSYRGKILASDGSILVGQADSWTLFAEPKLITDPTTIARRLAPLLTDIRGNNLLASSEEVKIKSLLADSGKFWVPLKNRLTTDIKNEIEELGFKGIGFDKDEARRYPEGSSSAHLLGFLGKDDDGANKGYFGLEGFYDDTLSSRAGIEKGDIDVKGFPLLTGRRKRTPSFSGADIITYIDKGVQMVVEEELREGIEKYGSLSGSVIVMDPSTGGILAMASYPSFDPQQYWKYSNELFLNPVISTSFEPGSVFKVIVMAAALDMNAVGPETKCEVCNGPLTVGEYTIHTWNDKYFPNSSMSDVIIHSDNIGMSYVAKKIGTEKNYEYLKKFGFGEITGIDLQGEMSPKIRSLKEWSEIDLYTSSFGQGIAVTPIQLITAVNVIANDGLMAKPKVVKDIAIDNVSYGLPSDKGKYVISKKASDEITLMMVEAAKSGEAKWTYKKGFGVAGKTGTAQIPISGHYDDEKTIASFIGFAPYDNPKFIMLVTLREPQSSPWASETAAPLWYNIAEKLFLHFGLLPEKMYN